MALIGVIFRDLYDSDGSGSGIGGGLHDPASSPDNWLNGLGRKLFCEEIGEQRYYDRLDRVYVTTNLSTTGADAGLGYIDPQFLDGLEPSSRFLTADPLSGTQDYAVGEWDKALNVQRFYHMDNGAFSNRWQERDPNTGGVLSTDPYPAVGYLNHRTKISTELGFYNNDFNRQAAVFFESLGYMLCVTDNVRHTDAINYDVVLVKIDLVTGDATIFGTDEADGEHVPVNMTAAGNKFSIPEFQGDAARFDQIQFVADDDSTPSAPKGFLLLGANSGNGGTPERVYLMTYDFNPTHKAGTPTRVHKRRRLFTRLEISESTFPPTGLIGVYSSQGIWYHPPTRTFRMLWCQNIAGHENNAEGIVIAATPALSVLQPPTAESEVVTSSTVRFFTEAIGSMGEPIAGKDVTWTLTRRSTLNEVLVVTGGIGTTSTVANPPIDAGTLVVVRNGTTTLVEGVNYSVVLSTGVLTWITNESGNTITASYEHRATGATPAHGQLMITSSRTDEFGKASTEVRYPATAPVNALDRLEATAT